MKTLSRRILMISLTAALSAPVALLAAEKTAPATPMNDQMQARMQTMQARMHAIEQTASDVARMPMMAAQMDDMQAMMKDLGAGGCPMAGGKGMMGMHGQQAMPMSPGMRGNQAK